MSKILDINVQPSNTLFINLFRAVSGNVQGILCETVHDKIVKSHRMMVEEQLHRHVTERVALQIFNKVYLQI